MNPETLKLLIEFLEATEDYCQFQIEGQYILGILDEDEVSEAFKKGESEDHKMRNMARHLLSELREKE